ncbi:hypothetical protein [Devosia chinhatensis]|uniref:Uncharacterized protein n=1 Tax=Devosia chinhatensis TaxID=429727 RepID=A0A0F5FKL2_9HYPH|nr:hypothetical protein [Devosia chinhatensis]KKB09391.1 hypothetical protein VE26_05490 [Devosia chinhatensis]
MRITAFIGAAVLALCSLAMAPAVMALDDPPPEICVLNLSEPVALEHALFTDKASCAAVNIADVRLDPASTGGAQGEADPALCSITQMNALDLAGYRQHEDPGRCLV